MNLPLGGLPFKTKSYFGSRNNVLLTHAFIFDIGPF